MHDMLIGYLLKALDADELECVERMLEGDPNANQLLQALVCCLHPLQGDCEHENAPDGLAHRTCQKVRAARLRERGCQEP